MAPLQLSFFRSLVFSLLFFPFWCFFHSHCVLSQEAIAEQKKKNKKLVEEQKKEEEEEEWNGNAEQIAKAIKSFLSFAFNFRLIFFLLPFLCFCSSV